MKDLWKGGDAKRYEKGQDKNEFLMQCIVPFYIVIAVLQMIQPGKNKREIPVSYVPTRNEITCWKTFIALWWNVYNDPDWEHRVLYFIFNFPAIKWRALSTYTKHHYGILNIRLRWHGCFFFFKESHCNCVIHLRMTSNKKKSLKFPNFLAFFPGFNLSFVTL